MALPRLPSLDEVFRNPRIIERLPIPLQEIYREAVDRIAQAVSSSASVPSNPVELAISNPKYRWMNAPHLHYVGERVAETIETNGALMILMPPQHGKSSVCSIWTPVWKLAKDPEAGILLVSYQEGFARRWGIRARNIVETYGRDFGLELDPKKTAGDDWELVTGGGMACTGVGGSISGRYVKLIICDDLIKNWEEAQSEAIRETAWEWWEGTLEQRIQPDTAVIFIATRYREDDLAGRIIAKSAQPGARKFEVISLPAKAGVDDPLGRSPGSWLWPTHKDPDWYKTVEATTSPHVYSAVHQQEPSPPGGNTIDPEWWRFYRPSECPQSFDQEIQSWDLGLDAKKKTDSFHCGGVLSRLGALVYLRDGYHAHSKIVSGPDASEQTVMGTVRVWNDIYPKAQQKLIERSLAGPMLIETLRFETVGVIPWPPKGVRKGSKEANLNACVPAIRSGNVLLPLNPDGTKPKWVLDLIEELRQFPRAPHDDWADMLSQGLSFLLPSVRRAVESDMEEAKARKPTETPEEEHVAGIHAMLAKLAKPKLDRMKAEQRRQEQSAVPFGRISTSPYRGPRRSSRGMW